MRFHIPGQFITDSEKQKHFDNLPWAEAVLFENDHDICCAGPSTSYFGIRRLTYNGFTYIVNVTKEKENAT